LGHAGKKLNELFIEEMKWSGKVRWKFKFMQNSRHEFDKQSITIPTV